MLALLLAGCGGATSVRALDGTTPLTRGALGPFTATITLVPREGRDHDACRARLESGRSRGALAEYRVVSDARIGWIRLHRNALDTPSADLPPGATVERLDAPVVIDNGQPPSGREVVVLVLLPLPWFRPRGLVERRMVERAPEYQGLDGLARKYFVLASEARVGGLYLWRDEASARAYFDDAWRARVTARYGRAPEVVRFDVLARDVAPSFSPDP
jgi:hypothetical protein